MSSRFSGQGRTWMLFVDGENFTLRAQDFAARKRITFGMEERFRRDTFVWMPNMSPIDRPFLGNSNLDVRGCVRSYYYATVQGDDTLVSAVKKSLWELGFTPRVFKKNKGQKAKGVDITLTKDMLSHAFLDHYEAAILVAGDGDYAPLVDAVKERGKRVICWFFDEECLNQSLKIACDEFFDISKQFEETWSRFPLVKPI